MRFATYADGPDRVAAVVTGAGPVRAEAALRELGRELSPNGGSSQMRRLLSLGDPVLGEVCEAAEGLSRSGNEPDLIDASAMSLGPPVPDPEKIVCVGVNYIDHVEEAGMERPERPVLFAKFANSLIGSGQDIVLPASSDQIDWEGELAVIIGAGGKEISADTALDAVAGYAVFNDVSARDLQLQSSQWLPGKAIDSFGPCGPHIVGRDEIPDPHKLQIETRLNGDLVQDGATDMMIFGIGELLAFISSVMTLVPGDIIATGTPAGVGLFRDPPRFLGAGDEIVVSVDGIGEIRNTVAHRAE